MKTSILQWLKTEFHCLIHLHRLVTFTMNNGSKFYCCWECNEKEILFAFERHNKILTKVTNLNSDQLDNKKTELKGEKLC
jgi:hypothetical protein